MASVFGLTNTLRDMKRYAEILSVLIKHGLADAVHELKLESILEKGMSLVGAKHPSIESLPKSVRLRRVMEELGPTFIKLGQVLSTRPDLIPSDWAEEFKSLQDNCPTIPFSEIEKRLETEFPGKKRKLFSSIETEPLATASIAQVHRAVLGANKKILLKILRPGIEQQIESDIAILQTLAKMTEQYFSNLGYSPHEVVSEFTREIHKEIDLTHEARSTERFRSMFADDPDVAFPQIYWKASSKAVMAMEEMKGYLLSHLKKTDLSQEERSTIVKVGARAVFRQCLEVGFFHADPHPGNLIAMKHGRLAFIDCGMVGQLDSETMYHLAQLVVGVVSGEVDKVIQVVAFFTQADPEIIESRTFRADVRDFVSHFEHTPLSHLNMGQLLKMFFDKLRAHKLLCPGDLVLLIKALTTIESVGKDLDPSFDMVTFAEPYIKNLVEERFSLGAIKNRISKSVVAYAGLAEMLPNEISQLLRQVRTNKVGLNLEHRGLDRITKTIEHASRNISFSLIIAALLIGSSILKLADRTPDGSGVGQLGLIGFSLACVMLIMRAILNWLYKA